MNAQYLRISDNNRYITHRNGEAFLWIGDTAWELFHKLNREEATDYLTNRAEKGFTIIQAVVLAENDGLRTPNPYGEVPLHELDPTKPNEAYFEHVDFIVNKAEELGLIIGMLPTWGDKVFSKHPGTGPIVFDQENASVFGEFLGKRYKEKPVVWILGGDRNIANQQVLAIWRAMASGIKKGDKGNHLITYHPRGGTSSADFLHNEEWLDFNMYQSGHHIKFNPVYRYAERLSLLQPPKPFLDGEPAYEDIAIAFWEFLDFSKPSYQRVPKEVINEDGLIIDKSYFKKGFVTDYDVRIHAYWNFLSGACGYTYGNNAIWQMFKKGGDIAIPCLYDWQESMDRPGAEDMKHLHFILKSRPFEKMIPDQSIVYGHNPEGEKHIRAAMAVDKSFILVYLSMGQPVRINMHELENDIIASWFDPRDGTVKTIGKFDHSGIKQFIPPSNGENHDWLLVLDDIKADHPPLE